MKILQVEYLYFDQEILFLLSWFTKKHTFPDYLHSQNVFITLRVAGIYILQLLIFDFPMYFLHTFAYILGWFFLEGEKEE